MAQHTPLLANQQLEVHNLRFSIISFRNMYLKNMAAALLVRKALRVAGSMVLLGSVCWYQQGNQQGNLQV